MQSAPRPNFFIVGAPKCGTTALYTYLRQHPQVFMPRRKEPGFFGSDFPGEFFVRDEATYLELFTSARSELRIGEATPWYMSSERAAAEIRAFDPEARIIIMLRNPVDMMYSLHGQLLYSGGEDLELFADALAAEPDRTLGRRLPAGARVPKASFYRRRATFSTQVERYFDEFPRDQVHVIIFDDFVRDTASEFRSTCEFLGVSTDVTMSFAPVNESKRVRSRSLSATLHRPPPVVRALAKSLVPPEARTRLRNAISQLNTRRERRPPMDPVLRKQLVEEFAPEVRRLSELLGRDLTHWSRV